MSEVHAEDCPARYTDMQGDAFPIEASRRGKKWFSNAVAIPGLRCWAPKKDGQRTQKGRRAEDKWTDGGPEPNDANSPPLLRWTPLLSSSLPLAAAFDASRLVLSLRSLDWAGSGSGPLSISGGHDRPLSPGISRRPWACLPLKLRHWAQIAVLWEDIGTGQAEGTRKHRLPAVRSIPPSPPLGDSRESGGAAPHCTACGL